MPISNKEQFVFDSNFVIALLDEKDVYHARAEEILSAILNDETQVFLSDVLINEVLSVLARRCEERGEGKKIEKFVDQFKKTITDLPIICLYELLPKHIPQVMGIMVDYEGCFNFHDAMFIFFLKQLPKVHFVTFDKDFQRIETIKIYPH